MWLKSALSDTYANKTGKKQLMTYKDNDGKPVLTARPNRSGYFALSSLQAFISSELEPYNQKECETPVILDFTHIRMWDIAALLWLVVALHHYQHNTSLNFSLCLPGSEYADCADFLDDYDRSGDFLRRWRFDLALANIVRNPKTLLVPEQEDYFDEDGEPRRFYKVSKRADERGLLHKLVSRSLVEIKNLANINSDGQAAVTSERITDCVTSFQSERMGDVLHSQCGIDKRKSDLFADHLFTEAVVNVYDHPQATIGMVAISVSVPTNELILAVVDNGLSIPETLWSRYYHDHKHDNSLISHLSELYDPKTVPSEVKAKVTAYATIAGVTSKSTCEATGDKIPGMGLTYIKEDAIDEFGGKVRILTDSVCLRFSGSSKNEPEADAWPHPWQGNLLRISIPLDSC